MGVNYRRPRPSLLIVTTWNWADNTEYDIKMYERPDGTWVGVPQRELSEMARDVAEDHVDEFAEERPEKYKWHGNFGYLGHHGKFTIESVEEDVGDCGSHRYHTDCGTFETTTNLDIGATYRTVRSSATMFEYAEVDDED